MPIAPMRKALLATTSLILTASQIGCGGETAACHECAHVDGGETGSDASTEPRLACPATEPQEGALCDGRLDCTYGDSLRPDCRQMFVCQDERAGETAPAVWLLRRPCISVPPGVCPPDAPPPTACTPIADPNQRVPCEYPDHVLCICPCTPSPTTPGCAEQKWTCYTGPKEPECPTIVPNLGTACSVQGTRCVYGDRCTPWGRTTFCREGRWELGPAVCPL